MRERDSAYAPHDVSAGARQHIRGGAEREEVLLPLRSQRTATATAKRTLPRPVVTTSLPGGRMKAIGCRAIGWGAW